MNQKGVLLTFMVFFIGIMAVTLAINNANLQKEREAQLPQNTTQYTVNEQFEQTYYSIENLLQNEKRSLALSRLLLFNYKVDKNMVYIHQKLPIASNAFARFNAFLNGFSIFSNKWVEGNGGLQTNFSFQNIKDRDWGGEEEWPILKYKILPQCVIYKLDYENQDQDNKRIMVLKKGTINEEQCDFEREGKPLKDFYSIRKIIVNIYSNVGSQVEPACAGSFDFDGGACWKKPFTSTRGWPYGELNLFVDGDLNFSVYNHFDPSNEQTISFDLNGSSVQVEFGGGNILKIDLSGVDENVLTTADVNLWFAEPPQAFLLHDFSFIIEQGDFGVRRLSNIANQESYCGDFSCDAPGETTENCPIDCTCPNSVCEPWESLNCADCTPQDNICSEGSDPNCCCRNQGGGLLEPNCAATCDASDNFGSCAGDCSWTCGNLQCDSGENRANCPVDCSICGDTLIEGLEVCDDGELGGETCESQGFDGGELGCLPDCSGFDTSGCCSHECELGERTCSDDTHYQECFDPGGSACYQWGDPIYCGDGYRCSGGACVSGAL